MCQVEYSCARWWRELCSGFNLNRHGVLAWTAGASQGEDVVRNYRTCTPSGTLTVSRMTCEEMSPPENRRRMKYQRVTNKFARDPVDCKPLVRLYKQQRPPRAFPLLPRVLLVNFATTASKHQQHAFILTRLASFDSPFLTLPHSFTQDAAKESRDDCEEARRRTRPWHIPRCVASRRVLSHCPLTDSIFADMIKEAVVALKDRSGSRYATH